MRGLHPPTKLILLLLLTVNGQLQEDAADLDGVETDSNSSEDLEANPSEIGDQVGTSEEEGCSDCEEETSSSIIEEEEDAVSNNATELKVLESAAYSMASVGSTSIFVMLDRVEGQENLQMVCQ